MKIYLSNDWNLGMAIGEFISSMVLTFLFMVILAKFDKKSSGIKATLIALSGLIAMALGWGIGSMVSGDGYGQSFLTPITVIIQSIINHTYNAVWFLILFQIIGTIIGYAQFSLYKYINGERIGSFKSYPQKIVATKSILFQPIMIASLSVVTILDYAFYDTGMIWNSIIVLLTLGLLLYMTESSGYIMFSPFIALIVLVEAFIAKKITKAMVLNFFVEFSIQIIITLAIAYAIIGLKMNRGIY